MVLSGDGNKGLIGGICMNLLLELKYKQGDNYCILIKGQKRAVTKQELINLIRNIPSSQRNCKISNNSISMKAGYGRLPIKRLVSQDSNKSKAQDNNKDYVEVYLGDDSTIDSDKYIKLATVRFRGIPFKSFQPYFDILELEEIKVIDINQGTVQNRFGTTHKDNLSSGMQSMLVALKYANEENGYTVDVSCCSGNYLQELCKRIKHLDIKLVIRHGDIMDIDTKLKFNGKYYNDGLALFDATFGEGLY